MTLYKFVSLEEDEKVNAVWDGVFITHRLGTKYVYQLYNLGSFFVEVIYHPKENKIKKLRPFTTNKLLEPYINQISLSELYT